jgi:polysaccharide chain length determinant protein (PEP-CTERM system associated)
VPLRSNMEINDILGIFLRRKWTIIFSVLFIMLGVCYYSVIAPESFESTTTILIVPQSVPSDYVRSSVRLGIKDRIESIQQLVLSRTRLLGIMDEFGLYKELRKKHHTEAIVAGMRKRIKIKVSGDDAFTLSFTDESPQMAMRITQELASFFLEENQKVRKQTTADTGQFLESQIREMKTKLESQEERLKEYKMKHRGELPQQTDANLIVLKGLQDQYRMNAETIRKMKERKTLIEYQTVTPVSISTQDGRNLDQSPSAEYLRKKQQLADLSAKYTDRYPEVKKLRREVEQLEKSVGETHPSVATSGTGKQEVTATPISQEVVALESDITRLEQEQGETKTHISEIEKQLSMAPQREQEMISIQRDYDNLKHVYSDLLNKKLQAEISGKLENTEKSEQFRILDPAILPEKPVAPDRIKILALGFIAACMLGFGGAVGLEALDGTLQGKEDFRKYFDLPVLASVPLIMNRRYKMGHLFRSLAIVGIFAVYIFAFVLFIVMYKARIETLLGISLKIL